MNDKSIKMNKSLPSYFINESFYDPKKLFICSNMFLFLLLKFLFPVAERNYVATGI